MLKMACEIGIWRAVFLVIVVSEKVERVDGEPQVPCFFYFGDSLADNGNNNNLKTFAKANYPPYGIDYPDGSTGRFTNGRNTIDILAELLGFDHHIPPFASTNGNIILQGVNYASGSAGIRDETGRHLGENVNLNQQIKNHQTTISRMSSILGNNGTVFKQLNRCLYAVGMGNNDYLNNYFMPQHYTTSKTFSPDAYAEVLIDQYLVQLTTLYKTGARKFALVGLGNIGCIPHSIVGTTCADNMNEAVHLFNERLVSIVRGFYKYLPDAKFTYLNSTSLAQGDPVKAGLENFVSGCCEAREDGQCLANKTPCPNRKIFVFWDTFHPTEASNLITAARMYKSLTPSDCYPYDIQSLAKL